MEVRRCSADPTGNDQLVRFRACRAYYSQRESVSGSSLTGILSLSLSPWGLFTRSAMSSWKRFSGRGLTKLRAGLYVIPLTPIPTSTLLGMCPGSIRGPRGLARGLSIGLSGGPPEPGLAKPKFSGEFPLFPPPPPLPLLLPITGVPLLLLLWWCWLACIAACRFDERLVDRFVDRFVAIISCCCECAAATMLHIWCRSPTSTNNPEY